VIRFALRRFVSLAISLAVASVVIFVTIEIVPGDPAAFMLGMNASPEAVAALRAQLGLDQGPVERYLSWVTGMLRGDFGISYTYRTPVVDMIADRLWVSCRSRSMPCALHAHCLSRRHLGGIAPRHRGRYRRDGRDPTRRRDPELLVRHAPRAGLRGEPALVLRRRLPRLGAGPPPRDEGADPAGHRAGPAAGLHPARVMRSALLDTLGEDFIRTARAKGLTRGQALRRHALRNAMIPVLTIIGLQFSFLLAGAIIIENVFFLPGLGRLVFQAISQRDLIVVESVVMLLVFAVILVTFLVDLAYAAVDPRLRGR
jgi:peptide/nickel transport system permease protein